LLITLEYPPPEMDGPPFPVDAGDVDTLFGADWTIDLLERRDILAVQPKFQEAGVSSLHTGVYRLQRK
jgi:thiopurine S-methyltransferase